LACVGRNGSEGRAPVNYCQSRGEKGPSLALRRELGLEGVRGSRGGSSGVSDGGPNRAVQQGASDARAGGVRYGEERGHVGWPEREEKGLGQRITVPFSIYSFFFNMT
jgi:hypothetical protein